MSANDRQVGGDHYSKLKELQPWDLWHLWNLNPFQATAIKHIVRYKDKLGIQDLEKAIHYLEKLIEVEKAKMPIRVGGITPVRYTQTEGGEWFSWPNSAPRDLSDYLDFRDKDHIKIPVDRQHARHEWWRVHAVEFSSGQVWDCINGWRVK